MAAPKEIIELVEKFARGREGAKTPCVAGPGQRLIAATNRQIDDLVYELYGLTDEEIKIVEGS
jgi:hypothetical protein